MTSLALADARRLALTSIGALLLSATCIGGAVAPARAADAMTPNAPLTLADWQADVGDQLDAKLILPAYALGRSRHLMASVNVSFDSAGDFAAASLAHTSGSGAVDRQVVRIARAIAYPPLPAGFRGRPQVVTLQAYFGEAATAQEAARQDEAIRALAERHSVRKNVQTAELPGG